MKMRLPILSTLLSVVAAPLAWGQTCTVAATGIAFGNYQPLSGVNVTSTGTVTVTCNPGLISVLVSYTIQIGPGGGGSVATRSLSGPGTRLGYQLYSDALRTQIWGDGTGGSSGITDGYLLGVLFPVIRNYTCYGIVLGGQRVSIGSYSDTTTVLLTY
jgi:spore coat protein U-like protein